MSYIVLGIGATIGPIIMSYCLNKRDWSLGYKIIGFIQCILAVILFLSLPIWKRVEKTIDSDDGNSDLGFRELFKIKEPSLLSCHSFYCSLESTCGLWEAVYGSS